MANISVNIMKNWVDGDVITSIEYKRERDILITAINDNFSRLIKNIDVQNAAGTVKTTQALAAVFSTLVFKEGSGITLSIENGNTVKIEVTNASINTDKIIDLNVTTGKIADLAVTTGKIADLSITPAKLSAPVTYNTGDHKGTWNGLSVGQAAEAINGGRLDILEPKVATNGGRLDILEPKSERSDILFWMGV